jgi:hypothetical protein
MGVSVGARAWLAALLTSILALSQNGVGSTCSIAGQTRLTESASSGPQTTVHFALDQSLENAADFNLVLSSGEESVLSGQFFIEQLYTFRDLILEARKFGFNEEAVGKDEPITTRFSNKEERAFIIDVAKRGIRSQFFITISTQAGQMTVDGGTVSRVDKREAGLIFDILKRLQSHIAKSTGQPIK